MVKTRVYQVNDTAAAILRKLGQQPGRWCVQWQAPTMHAPLFWYYRTRALARSAARSMRGVAW